MLADQSSAEKGLQGSPQATSPPREVTGLLWGLVVLSILSSTFLFSLDNTIVADIQPAIVRDFGSVEKLSWLPVAFLLGAASTNLFWGQCYGQFNAKYVYILCVLLFEVGSAVCGAAPTMNALIIGRAICGLGGAGMYTGVMVLISVTTTELERPMYFGLTGLTWGTGTILGPVIGGAFCDSSATWRWSFYINLCIGAACAPIYLFLLPSSNPQPAIVGLKIRFSRIDWVGTVIICGVYASGIMAMSFGGTLYSWSSGQIIGLFVTSGVLTIIFFIQQIWAIGTTISQRLFPIHFLKSPIMIMLFLATACAAVTVFVPVYFIPLYFQFVRTDNALEAGVRLLPFVAFSVTMAMVNGALMSKKPYYMPWYVFAGVFSLIGSALLYTVDENTSTAKIYGYSILLGLGSGSFIQLSYTVLQSKVEKYEIPIGIGFLTFAQLSGPAVALCIANAVFLNEATNGISALDPSLNTQAIQLVLSGASSRQIPGISSAVQQMALHVIVEAMNKAYVLPLTAGALTSVMAMFMKREKLLLAGPAPA
ncbi:hypothetical protein MMC17_007459 [Xylographa soralifera]|nr:hypothetical protein [Xylographa soralifera]